jgi:hypothetical protein
MMHPGILSSIPPKWRPLIVAVIVAAALAYIFDRPFGEQLEEGIVGGAIEKNLEGDDAPSPAPHLEGAPPVTPLDQLKRDRESLGSWPSLNSDPKLGDPSAPSQQSQDKSE